jgi:alcohol dehydrogenase YqhD (iron-dependent ADH family)
VYFGRGQLFNLHNELGFYGTRVLLVTYDGAFKKIVPYDSVMHELKLADKTVFELDGVLPNPRVDSVYRGIELCKKEKIDFILAVGGGSIIDCCKTIALGAKTEVDVWEFYLRKEIPVDALPFGTVSTMAATGSEMNKNSVITNWETKEKYFIASPLIYPKFSILDPELTFTLPAYQTACGAADIISHVIDQNISSVEDIPLQDRFSVSIIKTVLENAPIALEHPTNYAARANLMWCAAMALNHLVAAGNEEDWSCHTIEHALSGIYDIPHAVGLTIITPSWMRYVCKYNLKKFKQYAVNIWDVNQSGKNDYEIALAGIDALEKFFIKIKLPIKLIDIGAKEEDFDLIYKKATVFGPVGTFKKLEREDFMSILRSSYK